MTAQPLHYFEPIPGRPSSSSSSSHQDDDDEQQAARASAEREHEQSVHLRTQFLRRVAHDIASPTGVTTTVLDELAQVASSRPELVTMARRGLRRLLRLSEILAMAADLEAGPISIETTPEDLRALAKDALDAAVAIDGRRDVTVTLEAAPGEDKSIIAPIDRRLLLTSLREIIGNAIRFASSRVVVRASMSATPGMACITVEDDGSGVPNEVKVTLGERFLPRSTTRGLGLSLSIADEVITAHKGSLGIDESTLPVGRRGVPGAAVRVTLPLL